MAGVKQAWSLKLAVVDMCHDNKLYRMVTKPQSGQANNDTSCRISDHLLLRDVHLASPTGSRAMLASSLSRTRDRLIALVVVGIVFVSLVAFVQINLDWDFRYLPNSIRPSQHDPAVYTRFGNALFEALEQSGPPIPPLKDVPYRDNSGLIFWKATNDTLRPDILHMESDAVLAMRHAHEDYIEATKDLQLPFRPRTSGIVSTAGGRYLPIFIISLRMLRRTGCHLPVELFLRNEEEHGAYLCDTLLPSLNARCVRLDDIVGAKATTISKFQVKIFSLLFTSFENALFLDADNFLLRDPKDIFKQQPFRSSGLVTWPDFWASSASKHFYEIINFPTPAMNERASSESGQLLVSKASHGKALMATAYYDFYGPEYFYQLLTQDGPGGGDKETFLAGAQAVGAPFYQVGHYVDTIGYYEDGHYHGVAMMQYDPIEDAAITRSGKEVAKRKPFSVHHNYPKYDTVELFSAEGAAIDHATGQGHRLLGNKTLTLERFNGRDVEYELWEEIEHVACVLGDKFRHWQVLPNTDERNGTCDSVKHYRATVFAADEIV